MKKREHSGKPQGRGQNLCRQALPQVSLSRHLPQSKHPQTLLPPNCLSFYGSCLLASLWLRPGRCSVSFHKHKEHLCWIEFPASLHLPSQKRHTSCLVETFLKCLATPCSTLSSSPMHTWRAVEGEKKLFSLGTGHLCV